MLKEINPRNLPRPTQQLQFELVRLNTNTEFNAHARTSFESNIELHMLVCMLLNNPAGPVNFLFEQPVADLNSIYSDERYSVLCALCSEAFALGNQGVFIGMQIQNIRSNRIDPLMDSLDKDVLLLFTPTVETDFVPPQAGTIRAFLVQSNPSLPSAASCHGAPFLLSQCNLRGGVLGIPLIGKSAEEIESNVALIALSELFSTVIVLGGIANGHEWKSTHLILEK